MKRPALFLVVLLLVSGIFESCKYDDGPAISFRSRKERLINNWKLDLLYEDEVDITAWHDDYSIEFWEDGAFLITNVVDTDTSYQEGYWKFQQEDEQVFMVFTQPPVWPDRTHLNIMKLMEKELWVTEDRDSVSWEYRFIQAGEE